MLSNRRALALTVTVLALSSIPGLAWAQTDTSNQPAQAAPPATAPDAATAAPADQPADQTAQPAKKFGEEIVVTGSRVRRKDLTTPAPVTVLSREQIQATGKVTVGDLLQSLPEQGNAINTTVNNGGDQSTRVSLRSLGTQRTLVLLNGRRFVPGGLGADQSVDLNSIPTSAIERIEVLKDGASAVYGSDAVAGVINIITRKKYQGVEVSAFGGSPTTSGGGSIYDVSATAGHSEDNGSIMLSAGYYKQGSIFGSARDWAKFPLGIDTTPDGSVRPDGKAGPGVYKYANSPTTPQGTITIPKCKTGVTPTAAAPCADGKGTNIPTAGLTGDQLAKVTFLNTLITENPTDNKFIHDPTKGFDTGWRGTDGNKLFAVPEDGGDGFNANPINYILTPSQRIQLWSTGDYKFGQSARGYFEASYVNRQSNTSLAPEPLSFAPGQQAVPVVMSKDSLYNPFGVDITQVNRRLAEFGPRVENDSVDTYRFVTGIDGTLSDEAGPLRGWFWDTSFNYGRTTAIANLTGNLFFPNVNAALGPSFRDASGPHCGTPGAVIANCVPLDLFGGTNSITPDQRSNLTYTGVNRGLNQMLAAQANLSGDVFQLPTADRAIGFAAGYEYRNVQGSFVPNPIAALGLSTNPAQKPTAGGYHSNEGYAELSIPLVTQKPFVENLEATVAARVFDYSNFGSDWTYKFGGRYTPVSELTFRGTYSTAFRAPSVAELFQGAQDNFANVKDPCRNAATAPPGCGTAAGNGDPRSQLRSTTTGSPSLQPETAKIYTAGIVVQPTRWVANLTFTADYYNIKIEKAIGQLGESVILNNCYAQADFGSASVGGQPCSRLITRDPATGLITNILNAQGNLGSWATSGIDLAARYVMPTQVGRFGFVIDATWLKNLDITLPDGTLVHTRGNYDLSSQGNGGLGGVAPAWKFNAGTTYAQGNFGAGIAMKFIGSWKECGAGGEIDGGATCLGATAADGSRKIPAWTQWDLFLSYGFKTLAGRTTLGAGVNNLFNTDPPLVGNGFQFNTDPLAYDVMGRFVYFRLTQSI